MTRQQQEFVDLWMQGTTAVDAFRQAYPSIKGPRSANAERVEAHRILHSRSVQASLAQLPAVRREQARLTMAAIAAGEAPPGKLRGALAAWRQATDEIHEQHKQARSRAQELFLRATAAYARSEAIVRSASEPPAALPLPPWQIAIPADRT